MEFFNSDRWFWMTWQAIRWASKAADPPDPPADPPDAPVPLACKNSSASLASEICTVARTLFTVGFMLATRLDSSLENGLGGRWQSTRPIAVPGAVLVLGSAETAAPSDSSTGAGVSLRPEGGWGCCGLSGPHAYR